MASANEPVAEPGSVTMSSGASANRKTLATPWSATTTTNRTLRRRACSLGAPSIDPSGPSGAAQPVVTIAAASNMRANALDGESRSSYTSGCCDNEHKFGSVVGLSAQFTPYSRAPDNSNESRSECNFASTPVAMSVMSASETGREGRSSFMPPCGATARIDGTYC